MGEMVEKYLEEFLQTCPGSILIKITLIILFPHGIADKILKEPVTDSQSLKVSLEHVEFGIKVQCNAMVKIDTLKTFY